MARPCTAAEIWQRDSMCRALIRMYLYTTLSIEDISKVLTAVAQNRIGTHVASGKRSTAAQLKELLAEKGARLDPQKLRPQSDMDAQERAACWRSHKRYCDEKVSRRRRQTCSSPGHITSERSSAGADGQDIRLSWVQHALSHLTEKQCSEVRSILSGRSSQCSTISRSSSTHSYRGQSATHQTTHQIFETHHNNNLTPLDETLGTAQGVDWAEIAPWTDLSARADGTSWEDVNLLHPAGQAVAVPASTTVYDILVKLCCGHRCDCLHRRVEATIRGHYSLTPEDLSLEHGRDMFGDSVRHLAARWAEVEVFRTLHLRADPRAMNWRNMAGDTFLHILGPLWIQHMQPKALLEILVDSCNQGFDFLARNLDGKNFFSSLLPPLTSQRIDATKLRDLTNGLQYLLIQTPSHILIPSLLSQAPTSEPQTVAYYMERLLSSHSKATIDDRSRIFALSVSRHFRDKVHAVCQPVVPPIPAANAMHQHLQYLQHLERLSITPWEAPSNLGRVFAELLESGTNPNDYDIYDSTAMPCTAAVLYHVSLGYLTEKDGAALLPLLCQHGADLRLVTSDGETPLHMAIRLGLPDVVASLIGLGAELTAINTTGKSALYYPLVQRALLKERAADSKRYARAHRILVSVVDAAAKLGLPRPHNFLRAHSTPC